jgi:PEP-CTERM motif
MGVSYSADFQSARGEVMRRLFLALSLLAASAGPSFGATISWGSARDTLGPMSISNSGTLVKAFDSAGAGAAVNGTWFAAGGTAGDDIVLSSSPTGGSTFDAFDDNADLGDVGLDDLLRTGDYAQRIGSGGSVSVMLSGLVIGKRYELQIFFMDQRGSWNSPPQGCYRLDPGRMSCNDRTVTLSSGNSSVTLEADPDNNSSTAPFGQFALGVFTADASFQDFVYSGPVVQQVNAWQLRMDPIPEPSAWAMLATGLIAVVWTRRMALGRVRTARISAFP